MKKSLLLLSGLLIIGCTPTIKSSSSETLSLSSSSSSSVESSSSSSVDVGPTINEVISSLEEDVYAHTLSGNYGLSNPSIVGVIESEVVSKYSIPDDSEFANIIDFETFEGDDLAKFNSALLLAKTKEGLVKLKLPNRTLNLVSDASAGANISLDGFNDLYLEGGEETLLMINPQGSYKGGISINNSHNIHLENIAIDYLVSPTLTGIVESVSNKTVTMTIPDELIASAERYESLGLNTLHSYIEYDKYTLAPKEDANILIASQGFFKSFSFDLPNKKISVTFVDNYETFVAPRVAEIVALGFTMYGPSAIGMGNSSDLYFENITINTAPGMAFTADRCTDMFINRLNIVKNRSRYMTATADGIHFSQCLGSVEITNSIIENTHDDALNIKAGYYYSLSGVDATAKTLNIVARTSSINLAKAGEQIAIYDLNTFALKKIFTVVSASGNANNQTITVSERISGTIDWDNSVATNISLVPDFKFENNIVRDKRNRGILVQVPNAIIKNNSFFNVGHGSVMLHSSLDVFNEATMPSNMSVINNKFINNGYLPLGSLRGDVASFAITSNGTVAPIDTIKEINISNNYFSNTANAGISLRGVGSSNISDNLFYNVARKTDMVEGCLELENAGGILVNGNYNHNTSGSETFAGIILAGLTSKDNITLQDNYDMQFQSFDGEITIIELPPHTSNIVIDGDVSEWDVIPTSIDLIGSSLATGEAIEPSKYNDVFEVEMAKISYNSSGIYFAFKIRDDLLDFKTTANFWIGDCVEIFYSSVTDVPNADFTLYKNEGDVFQLAIAPTWGFTLGNSRTSDSIIAGKSSIQVSAVVSETGYKGEIFIPFTLLPNSLNAEDVAICLVFADGDRDSINRKRLQVGNVPHFVEAYKTKTARMQRFKFI
ncbi:MAG: hypothetical protein LBM99_02765 [Bacillales bacterium]|jgi:hypothetical protein|nr:hypothetical protein [Bacillales bacterium]